MLSNTQLFELCSGLNLHVRRREKEKMQKLIVDHFFAQFPDGPLTNLTRIMEEDAHFAEITSIVSSFFNSYTLQATNLNSDRFRDDILKEVQAKKNL